MGIIRDWLKNMAVSAYIKESQRVVSFVECLGLDELVEIQLSTTVALAFLVANAQSEGDARTLAALDCLYKGAPSDSNLKNEIPFVNSKIISLQKKAAAMKNPVNQLIAGGLPIWLTSLRSLSSPEVLPYGRRLWAALSRGDSTDYMHRLREVVDFLGRHPLAGIIERAGKFEVPIVFRVSRSAGLSSHLAKLTKKPQLCPLCDSLKIATILYGYPEFSDELERQMDSGEVVLGGCIPSEFGWQCLSCGERFVRYDDGEE